ncbi:Protein of uncharacterised function (DUF3027) [Nocardia otitidiscaviarum]|uniref:Protein of uncharacterized function (DUF3027) n=1 Tax=Nocardia otitidiscaviarum TaxID=1823 RepID=A0A378YG93_9NOCA|nr:Protein of uncharacterised function (DUF3027) [Nocardia otitidiscaviarum]
MRPILAEAVEQARRALVELEPTGVGVHLGVSAEDESSATHHFEATLPGYGGWQWAVVVAAPPEADHATVSESALLPGPDALVAPDFIPWDQRIRPGDLAPGDLLAPPADDPRLVPGYLATGDPVVDDVALELGLGRSQVLSREGREEAADRWYSEFGPDTDMARAAPSTCGLCGFYVPLAGSLRAAFGVCANAMGADGHVVHVDYGCGAHSDTVLPTGSGSPLYEAYDDAAVEVIPTADLRRPEEANTSAGVPEPTDAGQDAEQATIIEETATSDGTPAAADVADATAAPTPDRADATTASADAAEAVVTGEAVAEREGTTESTGTVGERVESTGAAGESADPTDAAARATVAGVAESSAAVVDTTGAADSGAAGAVAEAEVTPVGMVAAAADADATDVVEFHGAAEAVAPVEVPGGEFGAPVAYSSDPAVAAAAGAGVVDSGEATLFDLYDPDAGPYDDAWGVAAVNVEPQGGESAPGSN